MANNRYQMFVYRFSGSLATHSRELEAHSACMPKRKQKVVAEIAIKNNGNCHAVSPQCCFIVFIDALPVLQRPISQGPVKFACAYVSARGLNAPQKDPAMIKTTRPIFLT